MRCRKIRIQLPDYAAGALDGKETAVVQKHIEVCNECAAEAARYQKLFSGPLTRKKTDTEVNWTAFGVRMNEQIDSQNSPRFSSVVRPAVLLPVLVIAVAGLLSISLLQTPSNTDTDGELLSSLEQTFSEEALDGLRADILEGLSVTEGSDMGLSITLPFTTGVASEIVDDIIINALGNDDFTFLEANIFTDADLFSFVSPDETDEIIQELQAKTIF